VTCVKNVLVSAFWACRVDMAEASLRVPSVGPDTVNTVMSVSPTAGGGDSSLDGTEIDVVLPTPLFPDAPAAVVASLRRDRRVADRPMQSRRLQGTATFRYVFLGFSEWGCRLLPPRRRHFSVHMSSGRGKP